MADATPRKRVLIVDDDAQIREVIRELLVDNGFDAVEAGDGIEARRLLQGAAPIHLVTVDLGLPNEDGLDLTRDIRRISNVPIIMVTGKSKKVSRIVGLEVGADDYVVKPFDLDELLARIRALLRRAADGSTGSTSNAMAAPEVSVPTMAQAAPGAARGARFSFDGWVLDKTRRRLTNPKGNEVDVTSSEFDLLALLVTHPNQALSRERIAEAMKGNAEASEGRWIDLQIARMRKKIEADPDNPRLIKTLRGAGYVLACHVEVTT